MGKIKDFLSAPIRWVQNYNLRARRASADRAVEDFCYIKNTELWLGDIVAYEVSLSGESDYMAHLLNFEDAIRMVLWFRLQYRKRYYPDTLLNTK